MANPNPESDSETIKLVSASQGLARMLDLLRKGNNVLEDLQPKLSELQQSYSPLTPGSIRARVIAARLKINRKGEIKRPPPSKTRIRL